MSVVTNLSRATAKRQDNVGQAIEQCWLRFRTFEIFTINFCRFGHRKISQATFEKFHVCQRKQCLTSNDCYVAKTPNIACEENLKCLTNIFRSFGELCLVDCLGIYCSFYQTFCRTNKFKHFDKHCLIFGQGLTNMVAIFEFTYRTATWLLFIKVQ